ncbi:uncharacterized protein DEA37_0002578 [Paragonimus westermani]|uniref:Uncharacterized protein n=1 Tax=Paragonimus westermani TaxID=34504 RepID=A0A5J4NDR2_9TREM|nr:uncharacterized protein DEA37_0002578 [Paragonimus westermani]
MRRRGRVSLSPIEMDDAVLEPIDSSDVDSDCVPLDSRERALIGTDSAQASFDCPLDSQKTSPTPSNCEADFCEAYLEHLWGPKRVAYFFRPNFSRSRNESVSRRKGTAAEPLYLGGYPTGMLRGARVPFRPDLKPWLVKPVVLPERAGRKLSLNQQLSTLSSHSGSLTPNERRLSDGSSLLENLRLHAGLNCGAKSVWEFLRSKSYELLVKLEQELDADMRATFDAFTRERVLRGEEKPPLCDFVRENHSNALSNTMRNLKAPRMEKQFRKLRAMVSWAERNQDQFRIAAFQHDLKDMLTDEEISKLVSEKLGKRPPIQPGFCVISQAEADQISGILPLVHIRQNLGPLERPKPALEE